VKKVLILALALVLLVGIVAHGTFGYFSDTETSEGNTFTAWVEVCQPGSMVIVSDTDTMVTEVNGDQSAEVAWQPYDYDNDHWDTSITYDGEHYTFSDDADWIWETYRVQYPVLGRVVRFERTFSIPCSPIGAELYITVDNGYTVWINEHLVGCAQVDSGEADPCIGWEDSDLTEDYVHSSNWMTVEHYTIDDSTWLLTGENVLVILAANEHMSDGTADSNPAGLIYWLEVEWGD